MTQQHHFWILKQLLHIGIFVDAVLIIFYLYQFIDDEVLKKRKVMLNLVFITLSFLLTLYKKYYY